MQNKEIVKQVIKAFLDTDIEKALSYLTEDVKMGWPGFFDLAPGKDAVRKFFKDVPEMISSEMGEFVEEGNKVVGTGKVTSRHANGEEKNSFFCDIYELENGKIKEIKSYMVFEQAKTEV
ncbi:hypothetical protein C900_02960 [Fulvivirga imtechensis AK7]|uniref:SnoaL-like domain-containing protein n=1 Tax=Fulvivirga imtechensis AK7 TaxID=1237149 RepID=L8JQC4_9BACT|nr:nuclear transport factor 2 family protein [Fulvivirga imtechensis]ELR71156.1 hypothetical protein C900_02960 [Fulvivirga imtechensis AK7]